jgi:CheY-like chemotaxis protein
MSTYQLLLVEDSQVMADATTELLEYMGYQVQHALDASQALSALHEKDFDLVLMDIQLPQISGLQITQKIRSLHTKFSDIPIVALTSSIAPGDKENFIQAGLNDYLAKPYTRSALAEVLNKWCCTRPTQQA